jgi:hypothetical protein
MDPRFSAPFKKYEDRNKRNDGKTQMYPNDSKMMCARTVTIGGARVLYIYPENWYAETPGNDSVTPRLAYLAAADQRFMLCLHFLSTSFAASDPRHTAMAPFFAARKNGYSLIFAYGTVADTWAGLSMGNNLIGLKLNFGNFIGTCTNLAKCVEGTLMVLIHEFSHKCADVIPGGGGHNAVFFVSYSDVLVRLGKSKLIGKPRDDQIKILVEYDKTQDAVKLAKKYSAWQPDSQEELDAVLESVAVTKQLTTKDGLGAGSTIGTIKYNAFLRAGRAAWLACFPTQDRLFDSTWNFAAGGYGAQPSPTVSAKTPYVGFRKGYLHDGTRYVFNEPGTLWPAGTLGEQLGYRYVGRRVKVKDTYVVTGPYEEFPEDPALAAWVDRNSQPGPLTGARAGFRWNDDRRRYEPWADDPKLRAVLSKLLPLDLKTLKPDNDPAWKRALL